MNANFKAFLTMIAVSEGTAGIGDDGYNVLVGSRKNQAILFTSYASHPGFEIRLRRDDPKTAKNEELVSTAAGRYQILNRYWQFYTAPWGLKDFSPAMQDRYVELLVTRELKAMDDIVAGRIAAAIDKCKSRWASLPGAGYDQHENSFVGLLQAYINAGGILV